VMIAVSHIHNYKHASNYRLCKADLTQVSTPSTMDAVQRLH
jgi:hypothetical protein